MLQPGRLFFPETRPDCFCDEAATPKLKYFTQPPATPQTRGQNLSPSEFPIPIQESRLFNWPRMICCWRATQKPTPGKISRCFAAKTAAKKWSKVFDVDTSHREKDEQDLKRIEYSYPWLLQASDGLIHLFYTWNRKEIRHLKIAEPDLVSGKKGGQN